MNIMVMVMVKVMLKGGARSPGVPITYHEYIILVVIMAMVMVMVAVMVMVKVMLNGGARSPGVPITYHECIILAMIMAMIMAMVAVIIHMVLLKVKGSCRPYLLCHISIPNHYLHLGTRVPNLQTRQRGGLVVVAGTVVDVQKGKVTLVPSRGALELVPFGLLPVDDGAKDHTARQA